MMKPVQIAQLVLRVIIGGLFITAAVMKLFSLDEFEVYIYSFNLFDFVLSTMVARAVIAAELLLGALLIAKIFYKQTWWLMQLMLLGFTGLLIYIALFRHDTNCHCFGNIIELNPTVSIIKNLIFMAGLCLVRNEEDYQFKGKRWCFAGILVASFIVPFVLFMPDTFYNKIKNPYDQINMTYYNEVKTDSTFSTMPLDGGRYLVGVFASGCKYCKMSLKKVNTMMELNNIPSQRFKFYIWGTEESIKQFKEETATLDIQHCTISPLVAINLTSGVFPVYALVENGKIVKSFDYRGINEKEVTEFLRAD